MPSARAAAVKLFLEATSRKTRIRKSSNIFQLFTRSDRTHRASVGAGAAIDAEIRVDGINVAFDDGALRALTLAGSTCYACIRRNLVSHGLNK